MASDPRLCDNCGMGKVGCDVWRVWTGKDCCSHCKHPEPRESKCNVAPRVERKELVN